MKNISELRHCLKADHYRNFGKLKSSLIFKLFNKKYKLIFLFRLSQYLFFQRDKNSLYKVLYKFVNIFYNNLCQRFAIEIDPRTKIGIGLFLPHPNGIVINPEVIIGENCTILQQVTIGNNGFKGINELAVLGNNVQIGAGAKIIGPCKIGNNVSIGANAVVVKDIDDDCVVGGIPAKIISKKIALIYNEYLGE